MELAFWGSLQENTDVKWEANLSAITSASAQPSINLHEILDLNLMWHIGWRQLRKYSDETFRPTKILSLFIKVRKLSRALLTSSTSEYSGDDVCLQDEREDYQNCSVLYCVPYEMHTHTHTHTHTRAVLWAAVGLSLGFVSCCIYVLTIRRLFLLSLRLRHGSLPPDVRDKPASLTLSGETENASLCALGTIVSRARAAVGLRDVGSCTWLLCVSVLYERSGWWLVTERWSVAAVSIGTLNVVHWFHREMEISRHWL